MGWGTGGAKRVETVGRRSRAVADVASVNRVVVVAVRPCGGAEDDRAAACAGVDALERDELERIIARLIDEAYRYARSAGVPDGKLLRRANAAGPPVEGDELSPIQIHRLSCRTTDTQARRSRRWTDGEGVRCRSAEIGKREREGLRVLT